MPDAVTAAVRFAKSRDPRDLGDLTPWALQDAMIEHAQKRAAPGEDTCAAISRLCESDDVMKALARAEHAAEARLQQTLLPAAQLGQYRKHVGADAVQKTTSAAGSRDHIYSLMERLAKAEKRQDETFEGAFTRLLDTDAQFAKAYDEYTKAPPR